MSASERSDRSRLVEIGADMAAGMTSGQGMERLMQLESVKTLPDGVPHPGDRRFRHGGQGFSKAAPLPWGPGIVLVLVVLILLFGSLLAPWTILASLPLRSAAWRQACCSAATRCRCPWSSRILDADGDRHQECKAGCWDGAIEREAQAGPGLRPSSKPAARGSGPSYNDNTCHGGRQGAGGLGGGEGRRIPGSDGNSRAIGGLLGSTLLSLIVIPSLHLIVSNLGDRRARSFRPLLQADKLRGIVSGADCRRRRREGSDQRAPTPLGWYRSQQNVK